MENGKLVANYISFVGSLRIAAEPLLLPLGRVGSTTDKGRGKKGEIDEL